MPSSLGHFGVAYVVHRLKKALSLPALIVGSIFPDIDVLTYFLTNSLTNGSFTMGREWFHSLVGMGIFGTLGSVLLTVFIYPQVVSAFFRIDKKEAKKECRFSRTIVVSCLLGGLSHILIDSSCHDYNPLFYPFIRQSIDVLLFTSDWKFSYAIVEILLFAMLLITLVVEVRKAKTKTIKEFWKHILIGGS
jgi:membrane-bound metal-dependent hydrolase YbcI (DUF457 family)